MKKILIVEDDPMLAEIYQKKFEKNDKYQVMRAASGTEAQKKAKEEKPDLVLLDLVLPEMDGFDVLESIKSDPELKDVKVVPFSNLSLEDNRKKLDELGADGFIAKSEHTPQQLLEAVDEFFSKQDGEDPSSINLDKKIVDSDEKGTVSEKGSKKILMVSEDEVFLDVFGDSLEKIGYQIAKAFSGKGGQDSLVKSKFGLAVFDLVLKDAESFDIISQFKASYPKTKTQFVILKSEADLEKDLDKLKQLGVEIFLDKDKIDPESFSKEIKNILK